MVTTVTASTADPSLVAKSGQVSLLAANLTYSGHMLHWSVAQEYLAIADIWGQRFLRLEQPKEAEETATSLPTTTSQPTTANVPTTTSLTTNPSDTTETDAAMARMWEEGSGGPELASTTELYTVRSITVPADTVYFLSPGQRTEGVSAVVVAVSDPSGQTETEADFLLSFNNILHLAHWDLQSNIT